MAQTQCGTGRLPTMKNLEKRLFHLFKPADIATARSLTPSSVACPRVGTVRATVADPSGAEHEVVLELAAHRRGGMTLETRCTSAAGRAGRPCPVLAAVMLEVDRRGLLSGIHDQTPIALDIVAAEPDDDELEAALLETALLETAAPETDAADEPEEDPVPRPAVQNAREAAGMPAMPRSARPPAWVAELEERRRLVEPAIRTAGVSIPDPRRSGGGLMFLLDLNASADARAAVIVPCRMQLDVAGNVTGRPKPVILGPAELPLDELEPEERSLVERLIGAVALGEHAAVELPDRRVIERIVVSPRSAAVHLAALCETGRLLLQPEPRRHPDTVVTLAWDGGRPWEFAFVVEPDDDDLPRSARKRDESATDDEPPPRPAKATLHGMLVRGSQRKALRDPRVILRSGLVIFTDRIARLAPPDAAAAGGFDAPTVSGWIDQFERRGPIEFSTAHTDGLIERLAGLAAVPRLVLPAWTGWRIESGRPQPKLVLDDSPAVDPDGTESPAGPRRRRAAPRVQLAGRIWFDYGGIVVAADDPAGGVADTTRRIFVRRDRVAERAALALLPRHGVTAARPAGPDGEPPAHHVQMPRSRLDASVSQLAAAGWAIEVAGRRYRPAGSVAWNVTSGIDWFELTAAMDFGGISAELPALLEALARGSRAVELPDGSLGILPDSFAAQLEPMAALAQRHDGRLRYGRIQMALLDALLAGQPRSHVDEAFERLREELRAGERPEAEDEPEGFQGTLRHYQREGLGWLAFLERMGLGGCLADDMGLGKTIQVLAMLLRRQTVIRETGIAHRPSLVIVPKSLVFNWIDEAGRFAPALRVLNHTGNTRTAGGSLTEHDIVITTYGTLRRDIVAHREIEFDYVVIDEAQSIKNAASQAAKACRLLKARHRLALTGTPVENHIGELWSIFEFLNPGQLGSASRLRKFLADGRGSADVVARAVRPYLLRRTKSQVLSDLPEKTEQTLVVELGETQRKAYDELREHYRQELAGRIGRMGIGRSRIAVLEALLRLRQTACHPGLVDAARIDDPAAKLDMLMEQLDEVLDEGHKVLVFSQFTSFLAILRRRLDAKPIVYEYLDGRTTDRQARVTRFQEDPDCRLFLVSLKAGGQGLNLTAADYIYILDPWWNPAVEAQAVDRAHRIGQTRRVFAYRLIARDTVEEKIVALQDRKRELAESIVRADESMIASLTAEDVELLFS
jgi:superfamily II DNA or RNA helicase